MHSVCPRSSTTPPVPWSSDQFDADSKFRTAGLNILSSSEADNLLLSLPKKTATMVKETKLYDQLSISPNATQDEIKKAYR